jgi:hypothetical protein
MDSNMENFLSQLDDQLRSTDAYGKAKLLFNEKREVFTKLNEINKKLRDLHTESPEAVIAARNDVPFRNPPGRQKLSNREK